MDNKQFEDIFFEMFGGVYYGGNDSKNKEDEAVEERQPQ